MAEEVSLLEQILARKDRDPQKGVGLAIDYFGMMLPCLEQGGCNLGVPEGTTLDQWKDEVKSAQQKLVFSDPAMRVVGGILAGKSFGVETTSWITEPTKGACADYVTVVTSTKEDRDGDTLHTKGAKLDPVAPLLYQHNGLWPIGKTVKEAGRTDNSLSAHMAIIDSVMGRDAAQLAEFGALRTSHGFQPKKAKPKKNHGFDIEEFDIFEVSLVSVPSNTDAVVTLFSRGKLHHPVNKAWGENLRVSMPKQVTGGFTPEEKKSCCQTDGCSCKNTLTNVKSSESETVSAQVTNPPEEVDGLPDAIQKGPRGKISKRNAARLAQARELVDSVRRDDSLKVTTKASADAAHSLVHEVLTDSTPDEQKDLQKPEIRAKSCDEIAAELMAKFRNGGLIGAGTLLALKEQIAEAEDAILTAELAELTT